MNYLPDTQTPLLAIGMPGGGELLLILLIVVVVFGHNRIPQLGDALGKGIKNFRKAFTKTEIEAEPTHREVVREVTDRSFDSTGAKLDQAAKSPSEVEKG